jgi:hypothetical protein
MTDGRALVRHDDEIRAAGPPPSPPPETTRSAPPQPSKPQQPSVPQPAPPTSGISEEFRMWIEMECSTMELMKNFMADGDLLGMFAGAVFALQQDTLLMYSVDMWKTDDVLLNVAMDRMRPSRHGDFPERLALVHKALYAVDNVNLDIRDRTAPPDTSQQQHNAKIIIATMRSQAARVWLMTINSKIKNSKAAQIKLGVATSGGRVRRNGHAPEEVRSAPDPSCIRGTHRGSAPSSLGPSSCAGKRQGCTR